MTQYRDRNAPDPVEERKRVEAIHNAFPHVTALTSVLNPSGLVPTPATTASPSSPSGSR